MRVGPMSAEIVLFNRRIAKRKRSNYGRNLPFFCGGVRMMPRSLQRSRPTGVRVLTDLMITLVR